MPQHPILYSFRRCPYAMRARLGLAYAGIKCEIREVILRDKPAEMIRLSAKATVPVLHLPDGTVIDESYDIIKWALGQNDPDNWTSFLPLTNDLVLENDGPFKSALDKYKYASRFPEQAPETYRAQGEVFLQKLDNRLIHHDYLLRDQQTIADIALFPFIRQFAHVDKDWFHATPYTRLQQWLQQHIDSKAFKNIMKKYPQWQGGDSVIVFPG